MSNDGENTDTLEAPVEWVFPDSVMSRYATNLLVQRTPYEYTLNFFELRLPLVGGTIEEQRRQMEQIGPVQAKCVARIIIAADRMPEFVKVLSSLVPNPNEALSFDATLEIKP